MGQGQGGQLLPIIIQEKVGNAIRHDYLFCVLVNAYSNVELLPPHRLSNLLYESNGHSAPLGGRVEAQNGRVGAQSGLLTPPATASWRVVSPYAGPGRRGRPGRPAGRPRTAPGVRGGHPAAPAPGGRPAPLSAPAGASRYVTPGRCPAGAVRPVLTPLGAGGQRRASPSVDLATPPADADCPGSAGGGERPPITGKVESWFPLYGPGARACGFPYLSSGR